MNVVVYNWSPSHWVFTQRNQTSDGDINNHYWKSVLVLEIVKSSQTQTVKKGIFPTPGINKPLISIKIVHCNSFCVVSLSIFKVFWILFSGRRKIHFTFSDGTELAEEYDLSDNELISK